MTAEQNNDTRLQPEINKYLLILSKDPNSVVFAPLAETYRKAGLLDEAIATAKDGLQLHPRYLSGLVALGRAYYDKGMYKEAEEELEQVVKIAPDNLIAANILAEIRQKTGEVKPETVFIEKQENPLASVVLQQVAGDDEGLEEIEPIELDEIAEDLDYLDTMEEPEIFQREEISLPGSPVLENTTPAEESEIIQEEEIAPKKEITTETIAELYIKQGYLDRAIDIYQTFLDAQPGNEEIKKKLSDLKKQLEAKVEEKELKADWAAPINQGPETSLTQITATDSMQISSPEIEERSGIEEIGVDDNVKRLESWLKNIENERHRS